MEEEKAWACANPEKAAQQAEWFSGAAPKVDWTAIKQKAGDATRNASAAVLGALRTSAQHDLRFGRPFQF